MRLAFTISGQPRGKGRPRFPKGGGVPYTPSETRAYEKRVKAAALKVLAGREPLTGPVILAVRVRLAPAKSDSNRKRAAKLSAPHTAAQTLDLDNAVKIISDGLNKVVFRDDVLITRLVAEKVWAETPGVDVVVSTYPEPQP